jgi:MYXO-CTERM domain-containing protein
MKSVLTFAAASLVAASTANAAIITLDFEGIGDQAAVGNFYNGGLGVNYGVEFVGNALGIIANGSGGTGNFTNAPSMPTILFWLDGPATIMNVAAGFTDGFATYYTSINQSGSIAIYDGLNGTGNLLASLNLTPLGSQGTAGAPYDTWALIGTSFQGTAKSVVFGGTANYIGFDNVTFGSNVPAPGAMALVAVAGIASRRRRS